MLISDLLFISQKNTNEANPGYNSSATLYLQDIKHYIEL